MLNWAHRVEAVGAEVVLILCLCLTFKQLCYSSSMKREINCSPGTVSSSHCYGWQLQITNTFFPFHLLHSSVFQLVCSSSVNQKINQRSFCSLGSPMRSHMSSHKDKKCPERIPIRVLDAAVCVTANRSPLKQFMHSELHILILTIPIVWEHYLFLPRLQYLVRNICGRWLIH